MRPRVVIIGGGFGGLAAARALAGAPVDVTIVDRRNHHLFQPLLYQVAGAVLAPGDIAFPIRSVLRKQKNADVVLGDARDIDLDLNRVILDERELSFDFLIVATGATHSYFGNDTWSDVAPGLKSVEDALSIRNRTLMAFETAESDPGRRGEWLTFVIVGAGPTGVELAGSFAEIARRTLTRDFRHIDPAEARVILLEGTDRVLPVYPEDLSRKALLQLEQLGVEVRTGSVVTGINEQGVEIGDECISARTVIWAAGVKASSLGASLRAPLDRAGRVRVLPDLTIPGHDNVFVIGDLAAVRCDGKEVPGIAPAAVQGGKFAARAIRETLSGHPRQPFRYRHPGLLATIGRGAAVADLGRFHFSGFFAWLLWLLVHIVFLVGIRNRLFVFLSWAWSYVTFQRGARLITGTGRATDSSMSADPAGAERRPARSERVLTEPPPRPPLEPTGGE